MITFPFNSNRFKILTSVLFSARPGASSGYWLCALLPIAVTLSYYKDYPRNGESVDSQCHPEPVIISTTGLAMFLHSSIIYSFLKWKASLPLQCLAASVSCCLMAGGYHYLAAQTWIFASVYALYSTILYHLVYIALMSYLPRSFTPGEATIVVQGALIFLMMAILDIQMENPMLSNYTPEEREFATIKLVMMVNNINIDGSSNFNPINDYLHRLP